MNNEQGDFYSACPVSSMWNRYTPLQLSIQSCLAAPGCPLTRQLDVAVKHFEMQNFLCFTVVACAPGLQKIPFSSEEREQD